jgi:ribonuclease PH
MNLSLGTTPYAQGSSEVSIGSTRLLTTVAISPLPENESMVSPNLDVSISMLPRSTRLSISDPLIAKAIKAELNSVQKLVKRALQASVSQRILDEVSLTIDCHIVCSDAGIATAAVAGSWAAIEQAISYGIKKGYLPGDAPSSPVAALSIGLCDGIWLFDISADEASRCDFLATLVVEESGNIVEIKASSLVETVEPLVFFSICQKAISQMNSIFADYK